MARELNISKEAQADIIEIREWYESRQQGLQFEFTDDIARAFDSITEFPEMADWISDQARRKALRRFPYVIYFGFDEKSVLVMGVFHKHRAATVWKKRFR